MHEESIQFTNALDMDFELRYNPLTGEAYYEPVFEEAEDTLPKEAQALPMQGALPDGSKYKIADYYGQYYVRVEWECGEQVTHKGTLKSCKKHVYYDLMEE